MVEVGRKVLEKNLDKNMNFKYVPCISPLIQFNIYKFDNNEQYSPIINWLLLIIIAIVLDYYQ